MNTAVIDGIIHAECQRCREFKPAHSQCGKHFDNGIDFTVGGGYGMYYDPVFGEDDEYVVVNLCHECSVEVLKFIGIYDHLSFRGGHGADRDAEPCCDNCWIPVTDGADNWIGTRWPDGTVVYHKN